MFKVYKAKLIVFVSPDGGGKTTTINALEQKISKRYITTRSHIRFNILPRLGQLMFRIRHPLHKQPVFVKSVSESGLPVKKHIYAANVSIWKILIVLAYETFDYFLGYFSLFSRSERTVYIFDRYIYDYFTEKSKDAHFQDIWLNTLSPFGVKPKSKKYELFCTNQQKDKVIDYLLPFQQKIIIGINLEGAVKDKRITPDKLTVICRGLYQVNKDVQIVLLSSPKTYEDIIRLSKNMGLPYVFSSYKTESILDVAALIQNLQLIITPDTSIVHIASAFNVPIVSIHENNKDSYQLFAPKSQYSKTVFAQSVKGIDEYSINELTRYSDELISRVN